MSNVKQSTQKPVSKPNEPKSKPLFEDLQGHKHDDSSYNKLMNERKNRISK